jgi:hypothetical protein
MRVHVLGCIVLASTTTTFAVQQSPTRPGTHIFAVKPMILNGCVQGPDASADQFRLSESAHGMTSRPAGARGPSNKARRIKILGGFWPSTNIAAQAGGLDPIQAAMAVSGGIGVRETAPLIEVHVRNVRPLFCPQS